MMPPQGEPVLTEAMKDFIKRWIQNGARDGATAARPLPALQFATLPPYPLGILRVYAEDGKATPFREKVREALALLKAPNANPPLQEFFGRNLNLNNQQQVNTFLNGIAQTQQEIGLVQFRYDTMLEELDGMQDGRAKETRRWRALYDFARARLAARIAFMYEYNVLLGQMRRERPPLDPAKQTGWQLMPVAKVTDRDADKYLRRAHEYLELIAADNAGTPWQFLAQRERKVPLGLEWRAR
jgi:hypothetical protein